MVVVKVVELIARGRELRGRSAIGVGDKQCWRPGDENKTQIYLKTKRKQSRRKLNKFDVIEENRRRRR